MGMGNLRWREGRIGVRGKLRNLGNENMPLGIIRVWNGRKKVSFLEFV
jgi:hypothetical protein